MQLSEFSFYISKASFDKTTQERRWSAVASDTDLDLSKEKMSLDVFKSFINKAKTDVKVPAPFASKFWDGGMPYVSVSHYLDLDGKWAAGVVEDLYIDGEKLKAKGKFSNNPIGIKVFDSVCKSLYSETGDGYEQKIRISIGFIDYAHKHGDILFERKNLSDTCPYCAKGMENKVYVDGQLVHLAVTRIPCNQRTEFGLDLEEKSMTTRKQDAATIVGDELAEEIEKEHSLIGKVEDSLVIKKKKDKPEDEEKDEEEKEESTEEEKPTEDSEKDSDKESEDEEDEDKKKDKKVKKSEAVDLMPFAEYQEKTLKFQEKLEERLELVINKLDNRVELVQKVEPHPLDESLMNLKSLYDSAIESYNTVDERLQAIQSGVDAVGEAILESVKSKSEAKPVEQATGSDENIERIIEKALAPLAEKIAKITEQWNTVVESQNTVNKGVYIPKPRGMNSSDLTTKSEVQSNSPTPKLAAMIRGADKTQAPRTRL